MDPARHKQPSASSPGWGKVTVPTPTTLEAVTWSPSSSFSLQDQGSHGLGTMHIECETQQNGKQGRVKEHRRFIKKCSPVNSATIVLNFYPLHLPGLLEYGKMAKRDWPGHS